MLLGVEGDRATVSATGSRSELRRFDLPFREQLVDPSVGLRPRTEPQLTWTVRIRSELFAVGPVGVESSLQALREGALEDVGGFFRRQVTKEVSFELHSPAPCSEDSMRPLLRAERAEIVFASRPPGRIESREEALASNAAITTQHERECRRRARHRCSIAQLPVQRVLLEHRPVSEIRVRLLAASRLAMPVRDEVDELR